MSKLLMDVHSDLKGSAFLFDNCGELSKKFGCVNDTSRSSGLMITVPELVKDKAPMRYGLLAEEFYRTHSPERLLDADVHTVPSSPASKLLFGDDEDQSNSDREALADLFVPPNFLEPAAKYSHTLLPGLFLDENSSKYKKRKNPISPSSRACSADAGMDVPAWKLSTNLLQTYKYKSLEPEFARIHSTAYRRVPAEVHPGDVNSENNDWFNRSYYISPVRSYSFHRRSSAATVFSRFQFQRVPRAAVRKYLMSRDPKYREKYS